MNSSSRDVCPPSEPSQLGQHTQGEMSGRTILATIRVVSCCTGSSSRHRIEGPDV